ncbi:MAG TPA: PadR family transcriptional regulator [Chloroflexota bacterium]|nr:PadR family transcriptional regulator [Chloroflexota bacterium]
MRPLPRPAGRSSLAELAHLTAPVPMILVSLAGGPKHGYAIMDDITSLAGVTLSSGTVYAALARLQDLELIEALPAEGGRRKSYPYRLTRMGRIALRWHLAGVRRFTAEGQRRLRENR